MPDMSKYVSPKVPLSVGDPSPRGFFGPTNPHPKWHFDWFGRFAGLINVLNSQTDRQRDRQTNHATSVTIGLFLCYVYVAMRSNNTTIAHDSVHCKIERAELRTERQPDTGLRQKVHGRILDLKEKLESGSMRVVSIEVER